MTWQGSSGSSQTRQVSSAFPILFSRYILSFHGTCFYETEKLSCHKSPQVEKSGLITGTRLGAEREYDFDELEVFT